MNKRPQMGVCIHTMSHTKREAKRHMLRSLLVLGMLVLLVVPCASAQESGSDALTGVWVTEEGDVRIKVSREGDTYTGVIVWLKEPVYPEGHVHEGKPKFDRFNPDSSKRSRPLMGLSVLESFTYTGGGVWSGGRIYDADSGNTYRARITLRGDDQLELRGYIGISLFGRTTRAYRYTAEEATRG
jgi:uncharacterized protein (DUF2147 family)